MLFLSIHRVAIVGDRGCGGPSCLGAILTLPTEPHLPPAYLHILPRVPHLPAELTRVHVNASVAVSQACHRSWYKY